MNEVENEVEEVEFCDECSEEVDSENRLEDRNGYVYCGACAAACHECSRVHMLHEMMKTYVWDWSAQESIERPFCDDCTACCPGCGDQRLREDMAYIESEGYYCEGCTYWCEGCDSQVLSVNRNGRCEDCSEEGDGTLLGYQHTHPSVWLGGPLPRDEAGRQAGKIGAYVGFELEIGTSEMTAVNVSDWSNRRLGVNAFECKEDGSVEGFEIASQPMTPEYFESVDWEDFFTMLNREHPLDGYYDSREPNSHGLHVHVGRMAFRDDLELAAWAYLIGQGDHLERIGRRAPTHYCAKVKRPASAAIHSRKRYASKQGERLAHYASGRDAINFGSNSTVEIRAFRSTRFANELRDAVRMVYLTVEYVRSLRPNGKFSTMPKDALHWSNFVQWTKVNMPEAYPIMAGINVKKSNKQKKATPVPAGLSYQS